MTLHDDSTCPGCGLVMPDNPAAVYDGYYRVSPECWMVYTEVLGAEFGNPALFGQVHQLTVDTYALQHAGAGHKDKSVLVHMLGLYLALEVGVAVVKVAPLMQRVASALPVFPHFEPPTDCGPLTVCDVALAASVAEHAALVKRWAAQVWAAWEAQHAAIADVAREHLALEVP